MDERDVGAAVAQPCFLVAYDALATDFTGFFGPRTPDQGAATAIRLATLPDDGPSGAFFEDEGAVPW